MNDIEEFLQAARSEGTFHSQGQFGLDLERAERLLATFQLSDRYWYALKLVQCAVAAGASEIHFVNTKESFRAHFFGWSMDFFDTQEVVATMLKESFAREGALKHLAVAVNAAMALDPQSLEWSVWNVFQQERLTFDRSGIQFKKLHSSPFSSGRLHSQGGFPNGYEFCLVRKPVVEEIAPPPTLTWIERLRRIWKNQVAQETPAAIEHRLISHHCRYAPIVVKLDGRVVNRPMDFCSEPPKVQLCVFDGSRNCVALPATTKDRERAIELEQRDAQNLASSSPGLVSKAFLHAYHDKNKNAFRQIVVHDGVMISDEAGAFPLLMCSQGLDLDLSEQNIVKNEAYRQRVQNIEQLLEHVARSGAAGRIYPTPLAKWVTPLYPRLKRSDLPDSTFLIIEEEEDQVRSVTCAQVPNCHLRFSDNGKAFLSTPNNIWPQRSPQEPEAWKSWFKGALQTVLQGDYYRFSADDLPGLWLDLESSQNGKDGVVAEFWPIGQIKTLYYARKGQQIGWMLRLEQSIPVAEVSHRDSSAVYTYPEKLRPVPYGEKPPEPQPWAVWVQSWIMAVYRDAQLPEK